ncbi:MAG: anthranilate synthase component I family protein [Candidatus Bathyarchaeota archaeon]|nr:anthranilate synthase component I family protein [Candidatus Bathyarchaeota archaeon]
MQEFRCESSKPVSFKSLPRKQPLNIFLRLCDDYEYAFLFESMGNDDRARFSFIGFEPKITITVKDGLTYVSGERIKVEDPIDILRAFISSPQRYDGGYRYIGGAVGYISYDSIRYWEKLPDTSIDDLGFPDIEMGIYDDGIIFDHSSNEVFYFHRGIDRYNEVVKKISEEPSIPTLSFSTPRVNIKRDRYDEIICSAKEHIFSGDIFQVVLSKRYSASFKGGFQKFYMNLRRINPSPYMYFLKMHDRFIIGSSPETLVRVENGLVETYPIAGTRPVTGDREKDKALENEMLSDPKEVAEHIMLLDLARNDLGRVSEFNSVRVAEFMRVYRYSHVQHIVSKVTGKLRGDHDCFDVLKAVFPAGTVSGAPKVRAMEIIEELEGVRRGPYAGAVGYFSYNGSMDFAITIRTLFAKDGKFHIQVGSGIVADSTPENEWLETEFKARALLKALEESR